MVVRTTQRSIIFMKDVFDQYIVTKNHHTRNIVEKMDQSLFTTIIIGHLQWKCIKWNLDMQPRFSVLLFNQREISPCNLRRHTEFRVPLTRTVYHGSESISSLGPKIWDVLPTSFKEAATLNNFKKLIKKWVPQAYSCKLCKNYIRLVLLETYHKKCSFFNYWFSNIFTLMVKLISTFSSLLWYI